MGNIPLKKQVSGNKQTSRPEDKKISRPEDKKT
jgi:hypothetical protein